MRETDLWFLWHAVVWTKHIDKIIHGPSGEIDTFHTNQTSLGFHERRLPFFPGKRSPHLTDEQVHVERCGKPVGVIALEHGTLGRAHPGLVADQPAQEILGIIAACMPHAMQLDRYVQQLAHVLDAHHRGVPRVSEEEYVTGPDPTMLELFSYDTQLAALVDIGSSTFEYGQAYVALSRVKDINSLYIHDLEASAFRAHPKVKAFYSAQTQAITDTRI